MNKPCLALRSTLSVIVLALLGSEYCIAADWPQWRLNAGHSAAATAELPDQLTLQWTRVYSPRTQVWDDPLNNDVMQYDRVFEPVVKDGRMFVPFNDTDKVAAIDVKTGAELWTFYTGGPVRFAPVAWRDSVLFTSDDGHLYCVGARDGELQWRFRGGPSDRKVLGNGRIISAWPARGGPVVHDNTVYFAAGIWPFMGTFIYALDPATGETKWVNDSTSAQYIKQPHSAPSFAGVAPQGTMSVVGDTLLVPGGRSVPAAFDRHTGEFRYFDLNAGGKGNGGSFVIGKRDEFYVHTRGRGTRSYNLKDGKKTAFMVHEPVLGETFVFAADDKSTIKAYDGAKKAVWELKGVDGTGDLIQVGSRLYSAGGGTLTCIQLNSENKSPEVAWTQKIDDDVMRLLAASDRLFAVTLSGKILAFGTGTTTSKVIERTTVTLPKVAPTTKTKQLIDTVGTTRGIVLWYGTKVTDELLALLRNSEFEICLVTTDKLGVRGLRRSLDAMGLYGRRISVHRGMPDTFQPPPFVARLVVVEDLVSWTSVENPELLRVTYEAVRPYGGCVVGLHCVESSGVAAAITRANLENAEVSRKDDLVIVKRVGALKGAANWTHQYGDIANTVKSNDSRVKLPLGVLWFGGNSNEDILPRHGHGPPEQVVGGRLVVQGMNSLTCRDVYTGQVLWKRDFKDLGTFDVYYDTTFADTPLDTAYNQVHIPGANGRGTNYVVTKDAIYLAVGDSCQVLDVDTGKTTRTITLPKVDGARHEWGFIGVYNNVLLGGLGFANYRERHKISFKETDDKLKRNAKGYGSKSFDRSASRGLVAFDRHTGKPLWKIDATHSFLHNGIVAGDGKVFCLDKLQKPIEDKLARRGKPLPDSYRIVALDARTGEKRWEQVGGIFGTWLGYSKQHGLLLQAGAKASDRLKSEVGQGMAVYRGVNGDEVWRVDKRDYSGPCILHNDTILTNANSYQLSSGAFNLLDGTPKFTTNPLTQQPQTWQVCRAYGCNSIIASENMLTFRSGAAGYYDLKTNSGTGNLGGFKSGCTSNLVVANGVLNAPDYTRTCSCGYQNQTSLALVHMPEMDMWTVNHTARLTKPGAKIERIGINFGSPGDRTDERGTLWLDYPVVGGESAEIDVRVEGDAKYYHHHTSKYRGDVAPWIGASGVEGATSITIPLEIKREMEELVFPVKRASDDAEESSDGNVNLTSSDLELVTDKSTQVIGIRFDDVGLPRGTKIAKAYVQFTCDEKSEAKTELEIAIEETAHAKTFADKSRDVSSRTFKHETVKWKPPGWKKTGAATSNERTPDLTKLVQHVLNRPDWKSGNAIAFSLTGSGKRVAKTFSKDGKGEPRLIVELVEPLTAPTPPPARPHIVRLYFAEPQNDSVDQRKFDIKLNGEVVERRFDVASVAHGRRETIVREYKDVPIGNSLQIQLEPREGQPILSGVEIIAVPQR